MFQFLIFFPVAYLFFIMTQYLGVPELFRYIPIVGFIEAAIITPVLVIVFSIFITRVTVGRILSRMDI